VEAIVSIERGNTIIRGGRVVVGELGHWQQTYPVVLFLTDECLEVGFNCLVEPLRLAVRLRVECHGHSRPDAGELQEFLPYFRRKPRVSV